MIHPIVLKFTQYAKNYKQHQMSIVNINPLSEDMGPNTGISTNIRCEPSYMHAMTRRETCTAVDVEGSPRCKMLAILNVISSYHSRVRVLTTE